MKTFPLEYPNGDDRLKSLATFEKEGVTLEVGTGLLKAGTRMPDEGLSAHPKREVTLILDGELTTTSGGKTTKLGPGDFVTIPALQDQSSIVHSDTRLVYLFFGD